MKLKHGKKYETADGVVYRVRDNNDGYFDESDDTPLLWRPDGSGVANPDLIRRHYTKPKPAHKLDLKPGDVVELVEWEDGEPLTHALKLTYDGTSLIGDFHNVIRDHSSIPKGERPLFRVVSRS
jgi:hypothetical protein